MEEHLSYNSSNPLGFCLLPSELIQSILLNLALPEIVGLKLVNKTLATVISDQTFVRECNTRSSSAAWLFVFKKRWSKDAMLMGFTDRSASNRWFKISIAKILEPVVPPGEVFYFLTASGNIFLFACNRDKEVMAVDLMAKTVKKVPPSPLGPRGTSSWRRSGMKLVPGGPPGSGRFRFLFAELVEDRPTLFVYDSETDDWKRMEAEETEGRSRSRGEGLDGRIFLHLVNGPGSNVIISCGSESLSPLVLRPGFSGGGNQGREPNGILGWDYSANLIHVYGDGHMMIVKSSDGDDARKRTRFLERIEIWGSSEDGRNWEFVSEIPRNLVGQIEKPYGVLMGCLEERGGIIRACLVSNCEGAWDMIWLSYDTARGHWAYVPIPDSKMTGSNLAGISFSTGLNL
ncbi:uncharacterized protein LOC104430609 [Eucalyptus grandis]|uniref:uncharacterized protein LOC104430609 n=1 Tax=Eucalyptus grandis TaxID=71139 RepID=UPI00192F0435|nr:uncharacterized protein LOC104430609 [Eucalyptus grandis]